MFIVQVNFSDGVLRRLVHMGVNREVAEAKFFEACDTECKPGENRYERVYDREAALDDGFVTIGGFVVLLIDASNCKTDDEIRDELTKQPAGDMTVAEIVQDGELALKEGMTVDEILELCGNNLDACESHEIQGQILFKGSDGKWYTITTESIIGEATTQFVQETLVEIDQHGNGN